MYCSIDSALKSLNLSKATLHSSTNFGPICALNMHINIHVNPVTLTVNEHFTKMCIFYAKI